MTFSGGRVKVWWVTLTLLGEVSRGKGYRGGASKDGGWRLGFTAGIDRGTNQRKMPTWMCRSWVLAMLPSLLIRFSVQEREKRGVTMGFTLEYWT